jgi:hypothetical protein
MRFLFPVLSGRRLFIAAVCVLLGNVCAVIAPYVGTTLWPVFAYSPIAVWFALVSLRASPSGDLSRSDARAVLHFLAPAFGGGFLPLSVFLYAAAPWGIKVAVFGSIAAVLFGCYRAFRLEDIDARPTA